MGLTTCYPLCVVVMELEAQLEARNAEMFLEWIPRESNAKADRLADGVTTGFSPELRMKANLKNVRWLVLQKLLDAGATFQREAARIKSRTRRGGARARSGAGLQARGKALRE